LAALAFHLHLSRLVKTATTAARIPAATYRLQFNAKFTFRDAHAIVDYLEALGISDCYASSYLKAVPGSMHGYDVADPTMLNPEIGSDDDYWAFIGALKDRGMGHVIDIVPNHMGIAQSSNPWWMDVLENGPSSRFARFFDIEWAPVKDELADKVEIPTLGDQYGAVLERQELQLSYRAGSFVVRYYDDWVPIAPDTIGRILSPELDAWTESGAADVADADELRLIITAAEHLPPRTTRDPQQIAARAREKEVVKRRLAALVDRSGQVREYIDRALERMNGVPGQPRSFDDLDALLNVQSYRLAHWRVASEEINYRRFFDVNQLAALRMEDPAVFDEVHRFVFELVSRGAATGLRVDHVDGLFAPGDYLKRLQTRAAEVLQLDPASDRPLFLVVEKILGADEQLPDWEVHGTTGYEFGATVNNLFVDARHERALDSVYARFLRQRRQELTFEDLAYRSKKLVMHATMSGDLNSLGHQLNRFSERNRHFRDFTLYNLISTIKEVIACFPVYRTYISESDPVSEHDRRYIAQAVRWARRKAPGTPPLVFDFVEQLLLKRTRVYTPDECEQRAKFIGKFQQITSPVAAKGIEDTALYVYNRLLSLNEVGSDPTRFGISVEAAHRWFAERQRKWPSALSATSTHDTKRGEDVRARLSVLSEIPGEWKDAVTKWRALNRRFKSESNGTAAPDANEEYFIYQTLVGAWPFDESNEPPFAKRLKQYLTKALREAKVHTSWLSPDEDYEAAVLRFVDAILNPHRPFMAAFRPFQQRVAEIGIYNSLAQLLLKTTAPGVPDFYQGTELWDLSLVDPDNRRPVDYDRRRALLAELAAANGGAVPRDLLANRRCGRVKLFTMLRALQARRASERLFASGGYLPLATTGAHAESLFAFARSNDEELAITCVPRLIATLVGDANRPPLGADVWGDTAVQLPAAAAGLTLCHVFTGRPVVPGGSPSGATLAAADLFAEFPVALLVSERTSPRV
jgi:(1->4)-alpha-D-glucan 1-alpha-D-glucosylmutase